MRLANNVQAASICESQETCGKNKHWVLYVNEVNGRTEKQDVNYENAN